MNSIDLPIATATGTRSRVRWLTRVLPVLGAALLAVTLGASPAGATSSVKPHNTTITATTAVSALAAPAGCTSGNVCFWVHINNVDGPGRLSGRNSNWGAFGHSTCVGGTWNNCASSVYNNGVNCWSVLWDGINYSGLAIVLDRGDGYTNLVDENWNDRISSNSWMAPGGGTNGTCIGPATF